MSAFPLYLLYTLSVSESVKSSYKVLLNVLTLTLFQFVFNTFCYSAIISSTNFFVNNLLLRLFCYLCPGMR